MKTVLWIALTCDLAATLLAAPCALAQQAPPDEQQIARIQALMRQATCRVYVHNRFSGTGSLIRDDLVITAAHLFEGRPFPSPSGTSQTQPSIQVLFVEPVAQAEQPVKIPAALILLNQEMDLAIFSIPPTGRTPIRLARHCIEGQPIMAPSFKHAQSLILPLGKIAAVTDTNVVYEASAGRGSSGGPIINLEGELIGTCKGPAPEGPNKITGTTCEKMRKWLVDLGTAMEVIAH